MIYCGILELRVTIYMLSIFNLGKIIGNLRFGTYLILYIILFDTLIIGTLACNLLPSTVGVEVERILRF